MDLNDILGFFPEAWRNVEAPVFVKGETSGPFGPGAHLLSVCTHNRARSPQVRTTEEAGSCAQAARLPSPTASCCASTSAPGTKPASSARCV